MKAIFLLLVAGLFATAPSARAIVIIPTFDSSITSDPNAATIEATINTAIQFYEARLADPITVTILYQEISTAGLFGHSSFWYYTIPYSTFRADLKSDATTSNDIISIIYLSNTSTNPVTGTFNIRVKTANLRALGITGMNSGISGGYDGVIGLHTSQLTLSRFSPGDPGKGDLLATVEHEMDEVLGLGSALDAGASDPYPEDLFRYTSADVRNFTTNGDDAYFSIDGAHLLARFNQNASGDRGDWWVAGAHTPQVQDASATDGATPNPKTELVALDVIGYNVLPIPSPVITHLAITGDQVTVDATNGLASATYVLLTSTNAAQSLDQWTPVATTLLGTNGNFTITAPNAAAPTDTARFFRLRVDL